MINFKQVETFRAVMLSRSMTQAARELHTSQPNISRVIGQLERQIGMRLFERAAGRLVPTPEGRAFFRDVERSFIGLRSLENSAASILKRGVGRLRIGSVPSMALTLAPSAIQRFSQLFPDVVVSLHVSDSVSVGQWTATGYSDIGIASYVHDSQGIDVELLGEMTGVCIVPATHRLAKGRGALKPDDLDGEPFLSHGYGDGTRQRIDGPFTKDREDGRILACESHYAAAICKMVGLGMGVSVVNPIVAHSYRDSDIAVRRFLPAIPFPTYALHPQNQPRSLLNREFAALFAACMQEEARAMAKAR